MPRGLIGFAIATAAVAAVPAATVNAAAQRTSVSCAAAEVTIAWDGRSAVVRSGTRVLARATAARRFVSRSCEPIEDLIMERHGLEETARGRWRISCSPGPYIRLEVEAVRDGRRRVVGNRLAVFVSGWRVETAEALITRKTKWFSWSPARCHTS